MIRLVSLAVAVSACATVPRPDVDAEVRQALAAFLTSFENLDAAPFRAAFADDACVFFPAGRRERACGRAEIEATFDAVFAVERKAATAGPPYLTLRPEELTVQILGDATAVASFHLRNAERIARRTFVFAKRDGRWRIVHLHASNVQPQ